MRELFPGYFSESDERLQLLWKSATLVFDANILLNLYRYSDKTRNIFLNILEAEKHRIWIPYQVAEEYLRNRVTVIIQQEKSYDDTINAINSLEKKLDNARQHPFVSEESLAKYNETFTSLKMELFSSKKTHTDRINNDPIKDNIARIFEGKVGKAYSKEELKNIFVEGEDRYAQHIPPGYMDSSKSKDKSNFQSESRKYGDFIVWKQILEQAKEANNDIFLVTDDAKDDWWLSQNGKTIGPRPELVKEFKDSADNKFHMYRADSFLKFAQEYLGNEINEEAVKETEQVRLDVNKQNASFEAALSKYQALSDLVSYLKSNVKVGGKLPSERNLSEAIGWTRTVVREQLVRLESWDYITIEHGKSSILDLELPNNSQIRIDDND